jgi:hypothetical protein
MLCAAKVATREPTQSGYLLLQVIVELQRAWNRPCFKQRGQIQYVASHPAHFLGTSAIVQKPPNAGDKLLREMDSGHSLVPRG